MKPKEKTYREINGTTRIGDFLRKIGRSDLLKSVVETASKTGLPFLDIIGDFIGHNEKIAVEDKILATKLIEQDIQESKGVSDRWKYDLNADSWLSKNIRPMVLIYSWVLLTVTGFRETIDSEYLEIIRMLCLAVNVAYFGGREYLKYVNLKKL